ncbi:MAG TPA: amidase [Anaerolineae bacterium]|nr:amidase [Anaerolineae bacterium]
MPDLTDITSEDIQRAEKLIGLEFTDEERAMMLDGVQTLREQYEAIRRIPLPNALFPAIRFDPELLGEAQPPREARVATPDPPFPPPADEDEIAFASLSQLAFWLRRGEVTSVELTELYLNRMQRYDPQLHCVITLTEERALAQARRADEELRSGVDRGPLHGIPWGAKDLLAVRGYPTTWGAAPYKDQIIDDDAAVVTRLDEAGAVLTAKLSMGALAWGDVWFGGKTRTPWNLEEGASGSSAGSAAAVAAGLVGFSIGTETWGSIVSPATRNGVTGLRPTFGRVSRHGAMALSWTMDKIGPMCRSAEDCAQVFAAIHGRDDRDPVTVDKPFPWPPARDARDLRLGYLAADFEKAHRGSENDARALEVFREMGVDLIPVQLPKAPIDALSFILFVEAASAFDELTRSNRDDLLVRQEKNAWPNFFRLARLVPAVEYIQANRVRTQLMAGLRDLFTRVDAYIGPSLEGDNLLLTNLTGHPSLTLPTGLAEDGLPTTITLTGRLFDEATILALGRAFQRETDFHRARPPLRVEH